MAVDCENSYLSVEQQLQTLLRTDGAFNGLAATELVSENLVPALNCDNSHLTFIDFLLLSIGTDSCGKPTLRYTKILSCDLVKNCENNNFNFLNTIFAYDTVAKVYALVIVIPTP
jgi:hypothetical protein